MVEHLRRFAASDDGNAIIDWVVLMAGAILLATSVAITVTDNVESITDDTMERVEDMKEFDPI